MALANETDVKWKPAGVGSARDPAEQRFGERAWNEKDKREREREREREKKERERDNSPLMRNVGSTGSERVMPERRVKKKKNAERVVFDSLEKKQRRIVYLAHRDDD